MHPVTYDVTLQQRRLEIERACRSATMLDGARPDPPVSPTKPRRVGGLLRLLVSLLTPRRVQRAPAD
jgi:hypothetical protein